MSRSSTGPVGSLFDIATTALSGLPIPILVLSRDGIVQFSNRVAEALFRSPSPGEGWVASIKGVHLSKLGAIQVLTGDRDLSEWSRLVERLKSLGEKIDCVDLLFRLGDEFSVAADASYNLSPSMFEVGDEEYIAVALQSLAQWKTLQENDYDGARSLLTQPTMLRSDSHSQSALINRMRNAVFDSAKTIAFVVSADAKTVYFNPAARALIGAKACEEIGHDGEKFLDSFPSYYENMTEIPLEEVPAVKLVRDRRDIPEMTMAYMNLTTGEKFVIKMSGECMYDPENGEFVGGLFRIRMAMGVDDYQEMRKQLDIVSFETLTETMPHIVWRSEPHFDIDYYSSEWTEFTGLSIEESMGDESWQAVHEDDRARLRSELDSVKKDIESGQIQVGQPESMFASEARFRRKDGMWWWLLVKAKPKIEQPSGRILAWYGTYTDVHEHVVQRKRHMLAWDQMIAVLEQSAEVNLFAVDINGTVTLAQGAMQWGWDQTTNKSSIIGSNVMDVPVGGELNDCQLKIKEVLDGYAHMSVLEHVLGDRRFRTRLIADLSQCEGTAYDGSTIRGVLGLSLDITDVQARAALEIENAALQAEEKTAQNASKMKSQFLANMSHEMRTPLSGVIGLVDLLLDTTLDSEQCDYISNIRLSCNMLLAIVNDVLDFSKVESGRLDIEEVQFSLSQLIRGLKQLLTPSAERNGIDLILNSDVPDSLELLGDPSRIRQILLNLATNAIKFSKEGTITLTVSVKDDTRECQSCNNCVKIVFTVQDTGIGISPEVLAQLFQPFRQGDSSTARLYGGTGLGLTISQNLANLMHGTLGLESTLGEGSTATFTVPLRVPESQNLHEAIEDSGTKGRDMGRRPSRHLIDVVTAQVAGKILPSSIIRNGHSAPAALLTSLADSPTPGGYLTALSMEDRCKIQILVVEDNAINQTIALKTIRKLGFSAMAVWNGKEALDHLASCLSADGPCEGTPDLSSSFRQPTLPSIILLDIQMPVLDGYSTARAIRNQSPWNESKELQDIPIVALTASAIQGDLEKCIASGMNDYLAKPVQRKVLETMLLKWGVVGRGGSGISSQMVEEVCEPNKHGSGKNGKNGKSMEL